MSRLHRLLRKPFFGRFEVPWVWPAETDPSTWDRVTFANPAGVHLAGLWGTAEGDAIGTLVLAHPMGKAAKGFWLRYGHATLFRQSGFNVLVFDANGFGESAASSFDYPSDVLAAGLWAQARTPALLVGLVGASFGAAWGLCAMARAENPFRAAVLEAAFPTLPEFWRHYPFPQAMLKLAQFVRPELEMRFRPEHAATQVGGNPPVLLVHGGADEYTPPAHGERLLKAFEGSARAELWVVPGIEHTYVYRDAPAAYAARVVPFLTSALRSAVGGTA